mgnify:FL=1
MTGLTWNRIKHDVKVDKMNEQHKVLFNILDALYKAMENKDDRNALVKIINDLITYSKQHLTTEEALLEKYDYPELAEQKEQHKLFIAKIEEFKEDFRKNHFMLHFNICLLYTSPSPRDA